MRKLFQNFRSEESGATLVEYGVALILAVILGGGALTFLAGDVGQNMDAAGAVLDAEGAYTTTNTAD